MPLVDLHFDFHRLVRGLDCHKRVSNRDLGGRQPPCFVISVHHADMRMADRIDQAQWDVPTDCFVDRTEGGTHRRRGAVDTHDHRRL